MGFGLGLGLEVAAVAYEQLVVRIRVIGLGL